MMRRPTEYHISGSVGFSWDPDLPSVITTAVTSSPGEPAAEWGHTWVHSTPCMVTEALQAINRVVTREWRHRREDICKQQGRFVILSPPDSLTHAQESRLLMKCRKLTGKRYGELELLLQGMDEGLGWLLYRVGLKRLNNPIAFRLLGKVAPWTMICSGVVAEATHSWGGLSWWSRFDNPHGVYLRLISRGWKETQRGGFWPTLLPS